MDTKIQENSTNPQRQPDERGGIHVQGHIKIFDPETKEVFVDKRNAIHYENMSEAIAYSLSNKGTNLYQKCGLAMVEPLLTQLVL